MANKIYYTGIVFFHYSTQRPPAKYRKICNRASFEAFARRSGGLYINYYFKENKAFSDRVWLQDQPGYQAW